MSIESQMAVSGASSKPAPALKKVSLKEWVSAHYTRVIFMAVFVIPTCASLFYNLIAADRFVSEAQFVVKGVNSTQVGGLSMLLRTFGISRSNDDSYAIENYLKSRDALGSLQNKIDLREVYSRPESDFLTRFHSFLYGDTTESLFDYYLDQIEVERNAESGVSTLRVSAYRPDDAKLIADTLLALGEMRVNDMNARARADALKLSEDALQLSEARLSASERSLTLYRNSELLVDPANEAQMSSTVIGKLYAQSIQEQIKLDQLLRAAADSPGISAQKLKVDSLREQLAAAEGKLVGDDGSLASKIGKYEQLVFERELANRAYEASVNAVNQAREEALRKQIYLQTIVTPNLPDKATRPYRLHNVFTVGLLTMASAIMIYLLVSGSREHLNLH
ncbi:capsular polysaccharide transport system permease protein [Rhizobium sp. RU20A]|uniref:hypothetical protein n=1 Tax=Rhizobium sp. RU20A TaxID=1907412 RepID=UPI0009560D17|nr:hypothetical protein [Rhizobium sp. RU20A]SIQ58969.1 capsular polysaccharide transport system permease protein [Rhizobium sp. RU20A]